MRGDSRAGADDPAHHTGSRLTPSVTASCAKIAIDFAVGPDPGNTKSYACEHHIGWVYGLCIWHGELAGWLELLSSVFFWRESFQGGVFVVYLAAPLWRCREAPCLQRATLLRLIISDNDNSSTTCLYYSAVRFYASDRHISMCLSWKETLPCSFLV